jgi:hypothetical protein
VCRGTARAGPRDSYTNYQSNFVAKVLGQGGAGWTPAQGPQELGAGGQGMQLDQGGLLLRDQVLGDRDQVQVPQELGAGGQGLQLDQGGLLLRDLKGCVQGYS